VDLGLYYSFDESFSLQMTDLEVDTQILNNVKNLENPNYSSKKKGSGRKMPSQFVVSKFIYTNVQWQEMNT
jgi:hypothetical protein